MPSAAGIIIAAGTITLVNDLMNTSGSDLTQVGSKVNWRVIPATAIAALVFTGIEKLNAPLGKGLAVVALVTTILSPFGVPGGTPPLTTLLNMMGYPAQSPPGLNQLQSILGSLKNYQQPITDIPHTTSPGRAF